MQTVKDGRKNPHSWASWVGSNDFIVGLKHMVIYESWVYIFVVESPHEHPHFLIKKRILGKNF